MGRRLLRVTGTVLAITVAFVIPVVTTGTSTPASADMVVDGCTIVSNPTPALFTNCPNANFAGADLASVNLSYANLAGAQFAACPGTCPASLDANLSSANFSQANLAGAQFVACTAPGQCASASVRGANLTKANLSSTTLAECVFIDFFACGAADFSDDVMPGANLSFANVQNGIMVGADLAGANLTGTNLGGADLGLADLSGTNLSDAGLSSELPPFGQTVYVSFNGANVTGTLLVPSDQSVTATSQAGAVATWSTPPAITGATPGSCTPASGSTFPLFSTTVTCQVLDHAGDVATGTFRVNVAPTTRYFTRVLFPSDGAVLAGAPYLDAGAGNGPGVTKVVFEVSGGTLSNQVIATATPTLYGWLAQWNTTTVPNGIYSLQSVATDADNNTDTSAPITVTINNRPPVTAVVIPSNGATQSGASALLDASASSAAGIASVVFEVSGGTLSNQVIATATPTYYGWLAQWNTTAVPNGSYSLQSVATDTVNETTTGSPITVTVNNPAPTTTVTIPSTGATQSGTAALLDASASANVTSVKFELTGGTLTDQAVATATPTYYGWLAQWNTTTVPNGTYTLQSVAAYPGGVTGTSPGVTVTVANPGLADLANSSFPVTTAVGGSGCGLVHQTFDAVYPGSGAVGNVTLHIAGCVSSAPFTYAGSFTITTGVGTLSGSAMGPVNVQIIGGMTEQSYQITLSVTTATGSFTGTTGSLLFSASSQTQVASLAIE
jgi:uncharacterized protein YjbI with pentapeptide repeats